MWSHCRNLPQPRWYHLQYIHLWPCVWTEYSWCSMSSTGSLHFSSCMGSFCWPRASTPPVQWRNCTASSRPPSVDAASVEWYVHTAASWLQLRPVWFVFKWSRCRHQSQFWFIVQWLKSNSVPKTCFLSLCSSHTFWAWPGSVCLVSRPYRSSSFTTCGRPATPWSLPWPTSPTSTPSAWTFVSMVSISISISFMLWGMYSLASEKQ